VESEDEEECKEVVKMKASCKMHCVLECMKNKVYLIINEFEL
jgi:hypothetical protein